MVVAAVFCAVVIGRYLDARPLNLRDRSLVLADSLEQLLVTNRVTPENIHRSAAQLRSDDDASWYFVQFDVDVPKTLNIGGLAKVIERNMVKHGLDVSDSSPSNGEHHIHLRLGQHEFAVASLRGEPAATLQQTNLTPACTRIADEIQNLLASQGVEPDEVKRSQPEHREDEDTTWLFTRIEAPLPPSQAVEEFGRLVENALAEHHVRVKTRIGTRGTTSLVLSYAGVQCVELVLDRGLEPYADISQPPEPLRGLDKNSAPGSLELRIPQFRELLSDSAGLDDAESGKEPAGRAPFSPQNPKIAIIVDDGGYDEAVTQNILELDPGLTLAILPDAPLAAETAKQAAGLGFEIMLHMPMGEEAGMTTQITTAMKPEEIQRLTERALSQVPGAVGVNNHMGSAFTADEKAVGAFLKTVKEKSLYFVDSRTTAETKAYDVAKKMGIPAASRAVFLDNEKDHDYIKGQFENLLQVAKEQGHAIGICHFRPDTAQVLAKVLPELQKEGIKLIHVSELVQ